MKNFMIVALQQAQKALRKKEVPIGAVVVKGDKIISKAHNKREKSKNALMHAEIIAINKACKKLKSWRLEGCEIFVTLEPCPMCAGAIINARIEKIVYGAKEKTSSDNLLEQIIESKRLNHNCICIQDKQYEKECSALLTDFFKSKRKNKNALN